MKDKDGEIKIIGLAEKINDGVGDRELEILIDQPEKISEALAKIHFISQSIRLKSQSAELVMKCGQHWAHLLIKEKIGQGGVGEVYRAFDPILNCEVAVKFLQNSSQLYISQEQFLQEARNMATVRHPHVLAIHGATVDLDTAGYWGDYLDGQLLNDLLQSKGLAWSQQFDFAKQLCKAVKAIHNNGLVHGDIKAMNVMVQPERGAILLDFGSSRSQHAEPHSASYQQASPVAMAPEQYQQEAASQASDIFSLGLLYWHISSTTHPFKGKNANQIKLAASHLCDDYKQLKGPKAWKMLIISMVDPVKERRPDIRAVEKKLYEIAKKPIQRAKRFAYTALFSLAVGIAVISSFSHYQTLSANKETMALNGILANTLMNSSVLEGNKTLLSVDVLADAQHMLIENQVISTSQKHSSLLQLTNTYFKQAKYDKALALADILLADSAISEPMKAELLFFNSYILSEQQKYMEAEKKLLQVISLKPQTSAEFTLKVEALVRLVDIFNKSGQLIKVPVIVNQISSLLETGDKNNTVLAKINLLEGNYNELKGNHFQAIKNYQKAAHYNEQYFKEKNLEKLISKGAVATAILREKSYLQPEAELFQYLLAEMSSMFGYEHINTIKSRLLLADLYVQRGHPEQALNSLLPYITDFQRSYDHDWLALLPFSLTLTKYAIESQKITFAVDEIEHTINQIEVLFRKPDSVISILSQLQKLKNLIVQSKFTEAQNTIAEFKYDMNQINKPYNWVIKNDQLGDLEFSNQLIVAEDKHDRTNSKQPDLKHTLAEVLSPSDVQAFDAFGSALIAGDFNADGWQDLAVGMPNRDSVASYAGAVMIYYGKKQDGITYKTKKLMPPEDRSSSQFGRFGHSLTQGDFNGDGYADLVIGMPYKDLSSDIDPNNKTVVEAAGIAYVYYGSAMGLDSQFVALQASNNLTETGEYLYEHAHFGWTMTAGDYDHDGIDDLAISAPQLSQQAVKVIPQMGGVFVFSGNHARLSNNEIKIITQKVGGEVAEPYDQFGWSLASGDFNQDQYSDLVIGVPFESSEHIQASGKFHLINGSASGLIETHDIWSQAKDIHGYEEAGDAFGFSLATGDFNGDGKDDLLVGTPGEDFLGSGAHNGGAAQIIFGSQGGLVELNAQLLLQDAAYDNNGGENDDRFGWSVTMADVNLDGFDDAIIGTPYEDIGLAQDSGLIQIIFGNAAGFVDIKKVSHVCKQRNARCGTTAAVTDLGGGLSLYFGEPGLSINKVKVGVGGVKGVRITDSSVGQNLD